VESKTKRPMADHEFVAMHAILKQAGSADYGQMTTHAVHWQRYGLRAFVNFQFHLIARVDNSTLAGSA
jgi:hypothetical protein